MKYILTLMLFASTSYAQEIKDIKAIMLKGAQQEKTALPTLLKQISIKPTKESTAEAPRFQVMKVEKGSIYEREGIKVGDVVTGAP